MFVDIIDGIVDKTNITYTKLQKSIGYASTMIKKSELKSVPVTNVAEAMAGKVIGVSIN